MTDKQPTQLTRSDLVGMPAEDIDAAYAAGLCNDMLGISPEETELVWLAENLTISAADLPKLAAIGRHDLIDQAYSAGRITEGDTK